MNDEIFSDIEIESRIKDDFHLSLEIFDVIARREPVGNATAATVFLSDKRRLYVYIESSDSLLFADIKRVVARMNLSPALFVPPKGNADYFDDYGRDEFIAMFPSRRPQTVEDIAYYRTLAPYNPALIEVAKVKDGTIRLLNPKSGEWSREVEYSYSKIMTV